MAPTARCPTGWTFRSRRHSTVTEPSTICQIQIQLSVSVCVPRVISDDDFNEPRKEGASDDELFEPYSNTRWLELFLPINNQSKVQCVKFLRKPDSLTERFVFPSPPQASKSNCFQQEAEDPTGPGGAQNQKEAWTETWLEKQVQTKTVRCPISHNLVLSHISSAQVRQLIVTVFIIREELPNIYKCPYQGCTAVYKSADVRKVRSHTLLLQHPVSFGLSLLLAAFGR